MNFVKLFDNIDWVNVIAGYLIAVIPVALWRLFLVFKAYSKPYYKKYHGNFYLYHWSGTQDVVREKELRFSLNWDGTIKAKIKSDPVTHMSYSGSVIEASGKVIYVLLESDNGERNLIILYNPLDPLFMVTSGVMGSVSLNGSPMAWKAILCRNKIDTETATELLGKRQLLTAKPNDFGYKVPSTNK